MISVAIVNYFTEEHIKELLKILNEEKYIKEIIIIDNSNTFHYKFNNVNIISQKENIGFGKAINLALNISKYKYFLILNPDVRPLKNSINLLFESMINLQADICAPRFYLDDNLSFRLFPLIGSSFSLDIMELLSKNNILDNFIFSHFWVTRLRDYWEQREPFYEPFLSGACLLIDKSNFNNKLFDEEYFLYFEDLDLMLSCYINKKITICIPGAEMIHYWNQSKESMEKKNQYMYKSKNIFFHKFYGKFKIDILNELEKITNKNFSSFEDLGNLLEPPKFIIPKKKVKNEKLFFEISFNNYFVPMAQSELTDYDKNFLFPADIWKRLPSSEYFCRVRSSIYGNLKNWKFLKV